MEHVEVAIANAEPSSMACIAVGPRRFFLPLDCLHGHTDSVLARCHANHGRCGPAEPFHRDPDLFAACVVPFLHTGTIHVPQGTPVSVVAAEFDFWCLHFHERSLRFASLREGLEFRFAQFVRHCYAHAVEPLLLRLLTAPFRTSVPIGTVEWRYHGRALSPEMVRRVLRCLLRYPYAFQLTRISAASAAAAACSEEEEAEWLGSKDLEDCLLSYSPFDAGPSGSEAESLAQKASERLQDWYETNIRASIVSRDPREKDLFSCRFSLGPAKAGGADPVLDVALRHPTYGFQACLTRTIAMYSLPPEWTLDVAVPLRPPPGSKAAELLEWIRHRCVEEAARAAEELSCWTDFCDLPTFTYINPFVAETVHRVLQTEHQLPVTLRGKCSVVVEVTGYDDDPAVSRARPRVACSAPTSAPGGSPIPSPPSSRSSSGVADTPGVPFSLDSASQDLGGAACSDTAETDCAADAVTPTTPLQGNSTPTSDPPTTPSASCGSVEEAAWSAARPSLGGLHQALEDEQSGSPCSDLCITAYSHCSRSPSSSPPLLRAASPLLSDGDGRPWHSDTSLPDLNTPSPALVRSPHSTSFDDVWGVP